jgi:cohesin complex subunit SA-1/2
MPTKKKSETKAKLATTKSAGKKNTAAELSATHTPAGAKSPKRVTGASGRKGNLADAIHDGLVGVGSAVVGGFAEEVLKQYADHDMEAVATLVSVICRASGAPALDVDLTRMQDESAIAPTLEEALARVPANMSTYLLAAKDQKKFRRAFPAFFERVAEVAAVDGALTDGVFLETLMPWLTAMGDSKARPFRHSAAAATLAIAKVLSDLVSRADLAVTNAKNRKDAADAAARLEDLVERHRIILSNTLHFRCKDACPEIRLLTFKVLRELMMSNPTLHLTPKYMRYLSIALHDKKTELRLEGVDTLVQLLGEHPEHSDRLRDFLAHFATRLVEMAADTDTKVADLSLKLAALIVNLDKGASTEAGAVLSDEMVDQLLIGVTDDRRSMRSTAGTLLRMFIRCRVDSSAGPKMRAATLCSFATTLRVSFNEALAERYIVDALWANPPPMLLADFKHFAAIANDKGSDTPTVATAVGMLGAICARCAEPLDFGPAAKDDGKGGIPTGTKETVDPAALRVKLSKDIVPLATKVLEDFGSDAAVQRAIAFAIAAIDLSQLSGARATGQFEALLGEVRRVTLAATDAAAIASLVDAWSKMVIADSTLRTEVEGQLHQLVRAVTKQLKDAVEGRGRGRRATQSQGDADTSEATLATWRRTAALAGIASLADHRAIFSNALTRFVSIAGAGQLAASKEACHVAEAIICTVHRTALWLVAAQQEGGASIPDVEAAFADVTPKLVAIAAMDSEGHRAALKTRAAAAGAAADLMALPFVNLDAADEQEEAVAAFADVTLALSDSAQQLADTARDRVRVSSTIADFSEASASVIVARRTCTAVEAALVRVATGVARLFTFERLSESRTLAPQWMQLWTRVANVKPAADVFKTLFHVLRDRLAVADASALERDMLVAATKQCEAAGANPSALDQLHQVGAKLASMHFLATDKHYPVAVAIVKGAVEYAESTNELILHAAAPYCARLRVADALAVANGLETRDAFRMSEIANQSAVVRGFVSACRRAAKLEAAGLVGETPNRTPGAATSASTAMVGVSRTGRTTGRKRVARGIEAAVEEDDIMANIVKESQAIRNKKESQQGLSQRSRAQPSAEEPASGGWRGRGAKDVPPSQSPSRRGASKQAQPTMTQSSMLGDDEVFLATQEWA